MRSQDTTDLRPISFPYWMVKEIALDLEEKSRLENELHLTVLQLSAQRSLIEGLESNNKNKSLQLQLLQYNNSLLKARLEAQKSRSRKGTLLWILRSLGAFGIGWVLGRL